MSEFNDDDLDFGYSDIRMSKCEKDVTRSLTTYYINTGVIKRPDICSKCGQFSVMVTAHHINYRRPFDVVWLCADCHTQVHNIVNHPLHKINASRISKFRKHLSDLKDTTYKPSTDKDGY
jgi:ribosomal protein S27AE